jgi:hypothetical protein
MTDEHVIPQVLGGWLTIPFVCKSCNTELGKNVALLKKNGFIVSAIEKLKIQPSKLAHRNANIEMDFNLSGKLRGHYNNQGRVEYNSQKMN